MNNIALFVTHSVFLTEDDATKLADGETIGAVGHCVPVWINAKTGKSTEPAREIFCNYVLHNSREKEREVKVMPKKGYEIFLPKCSGWVPPPESDYEKMALWPSEDRIAYVREMERWWFSNPKPPDAEDLRRGYLRFEVRKTESRPKQHSEQHVVEISFWKRLAESLAT